LAPTFIRMNNKDRSEYLISLGNRVRQLREEKGYTQTEFANLIGKDQPSINRMEKGRINPSYIYLIEVAEGLEIDIKQMFK